LKDPRFGQIGPQPVAGRKAPANPRFTCRSNFDIEFSSPAHDADSHCVEFQNDKEIVECSGIVLPLVLVHTSMMFREQVFEALVDFGDESLPAPLVEKLIEATES
jgi:hypothetical protein